MLVAYVQPVSAGLADDTRALEELRLDTLVEIARERGRSLIPDTITETRRDPYVLVDAEAADGTPIRLPVDVSVARSVYGVSADTPPSGYLLGWEARAV